MPEEFGTVNLKQGAQTREIELIRRHYRNHRDALAKLVPDAPTEYLAGEYQRLITEIDLAVRKLDELEGRASAATAAAAATALAETNPAIRPATGAGNRPLVRPNEPVGATSYVPPATAGSQSRVAMIVIAGVVVLAIIGWLIWRASSERKATPAIQQQPITSTNNAPTPAVTPAPQPAPAPAAAQVLKVSPAAADYGTIRKGTRAVRQFTVTNTGAAPVEIVVSRSACRCLYYDYNGKLPPKGQETITVTVDGARAKLGPLQETIDVHARKEPAVAASMTVKAVIQ